MRSNSRCSRVTSRRTIVTSNHDRTDLRLCYYIPTRRVTDIRLCQYIPTRRVTYIRLCYYIPTHDRTYLLRTIDTSNRDRTYLLRTIDTSNRDGIDLRRTIDTSEFNTCKIFLNSSHFYIGDISFRFGEYLHLFFEQLPFLNGRHEL